MVLKYIGEGKKWEIFNQWQGDYYQHNDVLRRLWTNQIVLIVTRWHNQQYWQCQIKTHNVWVCQLICTQCILAKKSVIGGSITCCKITIIIYNIFILKSISRRLYVVRVCISYNIPPCSCSGYSETNTKERMKHACVHVCNSDVFFW